MGRAFQRAAAVALAALSLGGSAQPAPRSTVSAGTIEGELSPGEVLEIPVELAARTYVEFQVEQVRGDVTVTLADPEGVAIDSSDLPGKPWLAEIVATVTTVDGAYSLRIKATEATGETVRFRFIKTAERSAVAADDALLTALAAWRQALGLKEEQTEDSLRQGMDLLESAATTLAGFEFDLWEARIRHELGKCHARLGSGGEAEAEYRQAIDLLETIEHPITLAEALNSYGDLLTNRGDRDQAEPLYERALDLAEIEGDRRGQALAWNNLGVLYFYEGELDQVVEAFETALELQVASGAEGEQADTLANLGATYQTLGRYSDSLRVSEQALALARRLDDKAREMNVLNNRGSLFRAVGDLRAAVGAFQTALDLASRLGSRQKEAVVAGNLGSLYRALGQRERSRRYLERALEAASESGLPAEEAWALNGLGALAREAREPEAGAFFSRALERSAEADDKFTAAYSLFGQAKSYLDSNEAESAVSALEEALAIQEEVSDRPGQLATLRELGRALSLLGETSAADSYFERALALARLVGDPYQEASTRARYAQFLAREGDLVKARDHVSSALTTIESMRRAVAQPDYRAGFLSRSQKDFTLLIDILQQLDHLYPNEGYADQAFEVSERARARSLIELLAEAKTGLERELPAELRARRIDLAGRLSMAQRQLTEALQEADMDESRLGALREEIRVANLERVEVEHQTRLSDSRWQNLEAPRPLRVSEARQLLSPGQALVSFVLGRERSFVFALTADEFVLEPLASEEELQPLVAKLLRYLEVPSRRNMGQLTTAAGRLYEQLLGPVEGVLADSRQLVIVPDGNLHYLPFEVLVGNESDGGGATYVLERWAVSYAPSASTLSLLKGRHSSEPRAARRSPRLVAFADPTLPGSLPAQGSAEGLTRGLAKRESWTWRQLAGARDEVESIAQLFPQGEAEVFVGADATEARFKNEPTVRRAQYIHVASHALIDDTEPALSSLLLSPSDDGDDGLLQTHEVFDLVLSADLVVLSGCETALGQAVRGEGILGLTRAFLYAGAGSVSVSLWPVEDASTAAVMAEFYRELSGGQGAAEALRRAKLSQLRGKAKSHPYFWAPFVLVGSPS